jgi:hypothetical protein
VTTRLQGPAFTPWAKGLALLAVILVVRQAWRALNPLPPTTGLTFWVLALAGMCLLYGLGHIWFTQTAVDDTHIRQTGWLSTQVEMAKLTQVKLIYVPYLSWLMAPRLVVKTGGLRSWVFHAADPGVLKRFWQLAHDAQVPPQLKTPPSVP